MFGYGSYIDDNILGLTHIFCYYIAPKFILKEMDAYWDNALLLDI